MDLSDAREVERIARKATGEYFWMEKKCPRCGVEVTMVKLQIQTFKEESTDDYEYVPYLRCLGCLTLYNEVLQEMEKGEENGH